MGKSHEATPREPVTDGSPSAAEAGTSSSAAIRRSGGRSAGRGDNVVDLRPPTTPAERPDEHDGHVGVDGHAAGEDGQSPRTDGSVGTDAGREREDDPVTAQEPATRPAGTGGEKATKSRARKAAKPAEATRAAKGTKATRSRKATKTTEATKTTKATRSRKATKTTEATKTTKATGTAKARKAAKRPASGGATSRRNDAGEDAGEKADVPAATAYPAEELRRDLLLARISRAIDDREIALQKQSRVFFQISGAGHEALLLALAHELRPGYDWFFPYYRDLALMLGLGMTSEQILLQSVGSSADPASGGRQMPAHWGYRPFNVVTQSSPTGSQCIPAVGCAEAGRYIVRHPGLGLPAHGDELTYVSLGEGACSQGEFWESLNTACVEHLPVLFVVADNGFAISVPASEQAPAPVHELVRGFAGLTVRYVDGTDYFAVREAAREVVAQVRAGVGPALIHARVTRPYSHSAADTQSKYRLPDELALEIADDPVERLERDLIDAGVVSAEEADAIREEGHRTVADAARAALAAPRPDPATILDHVVALPDLPDRGDPPPGEGAELVAMGEAIRRSLHDVMARDERVRVFGEDVADAREAILADVEGKGGVFGTTHGLQRAYGRARCFNTPLAEANIIGRSVGQAIRGLRPAPEIQFFDYIWPAMQQIRSEAATIRWRSNGDWSCPMVIRVPIGGYLQGGSIWHSQSGESIFAHIPGLLIAFPSRAADAAGLLQAAFRCEDPVLFLEHKHLLRQPYTRDPYPGPDHVVPFGKGRRVLRGDDLTLVTWGATVERSRLAAERLAAEDGVSIDLIDLRTLVPWDREMVAESVARTARLLVVHEDVLMHGFGAEVAAWASDELFWNLDAPVGRLGAEHCHVGYAPELERAILPQADDVAAAARRLLAA